MYCIYVISYIHVRNPVWIETTVCLYVLYICHLLYTCQKPGVDRNYWVCISSASERKETWINVHPLLGHPVFENFVSWCQTLKNSSASFLCIQETYFISTISQFDFKHRYLWTGPFFLNIVLYICHLLYTCQKPGMDKNYCLLVCIVYMSSLIYMSETRYG
jgi:hypothetical protein